MTIAPGSVVQLTYGQAVRWTVDTQLAAPIESYRLIRSDGDHVCGFSAARVDFASVEPPPVFLPGARVSLPFGERGTVVETQGETIVCNVENLIRLSGGDYLEWTGERPIPIAQIVCLLPVNRSAVDVDLVGVPTPVPTHRRFRESLTCRCRRRASPAESSNPSGSRTRGSRRSSSPTRCSTPPPRFSTR